MMGFTAFNPSYAARSIRRRDVLAAALPFWLFGGTNAMAAGAMITRPIPSSGEAMPVIGLGTSQVFDVGADAAARGPLHAVLQAFVAAGARIIDTPPMYGPAQAVTRHPAAHPAPPPP